MSTPANAPPKLQKSMSSQRNKQELHEKVKPKMKIKQGLRAQVKHNINSR
jgi:hypothetical protein